MRVLLPLLVCLACASRGPVVEPGEADPARIERDVAWLADDARQGRGLASAGLGEAVRYVAREFERAGLEPGAAGGTWLQEFVSPVSISVSEARITLGGIPLERGRDFEAFLASTSGALEAPVVFAGYGITDPESGWDDYAGVDARGSVVLVLDDRPRRGPLADGGGARFLRRAYKVANAKRHGAGAVLLAPAAPQPGLPGGAGREDANPTIRPSGILTLSISRDAAERLLAVAGGPTLAERQQWIDAQARPAPDRLGGSRVRCEVRIERESRKLANVVALRPGADAELTRETVLVGAHLDHLGRGEYGSLAPDRRGEIHNGADDNASGVAALLELGRLLAAGPATRRSVMLVAFTAEEVGLAGSAHFVEAPPRPLADAVSMVNLDMVGRLSDGGLTVFGAETSPGFERLVRDAADGLELELDFSEGAFGPSDQTSFHARGLPVLLFFTGIHPDYHTPDDDPERVNPRGEARVVRLVERVVRRLADAPERPEVVRAQAPARAGEARGYGPYLGTVPAFGGEPARGVRLQAVRPGSPAARAGLRAGDVIVEFTGAPVANLQEFAALLQASRAGERVQIVFERDGRRVEAWAVLGQRR